MVNETLQVILVFIVINNYILASIEDHLDDFCHHRQTVRPHRQAENLTVVTSDGGDENLLFHMICKSSSD